MGGIFVTIKSSLVGFVGMAVEEDIYKPWHSALVEVFVLSQYDRNNPSAVIRFTNEKTPVTWQGVVYEPLPIEASGFEFSGKGKLPRPKIRVGNVGGVMSSLIKNFNDLVGARLVRKRTLEDYLDGKPGANPNTFFADDVWFIERKEKENKLEIEFELSSILDKEDRQVPNRIVVQSPCAALWLGGYRGPYCGYAGPPVATADDTPTTDPALDRCGGRLASCKLRQWPDGVLNYSSFPGARRFN